MAEKYGERPKKFTREWWKWYWMYYKIHTIIAVVAVFGIALGIYQKVTEVKYDLNLTYMAQASYIGNNGENELTNALLQFVKDANDDGEVHLYINQINITGDSAQTSYDINLRSKHDLEFSDPYSYLYIYDGAEFEMVEKNAGIVKLGDLYLPVDEWAEIPDGTDTLSGSDGVVYGISLKDSKIMHECGIDSDDMYVFVKNDVLFEEKNEIAEASAKTIANELIK